MGARAISTITGGGSFSRTNIDQINNNFTALNTVDVWVRPQYGADSNVGSYDKPFKSLSGCNRAIEPGVVIGLQGVLLEEYSGPIVGDVTIVGMANQPRQATTSGAPNGGGATWLSPSGGTGALITVNGQGWKLQNLFFNNSATAAPCIQIVTAGDPPLAADGAHVQILDCVLTGTDDGIQATGGTNFVTVKGCRLFGFSGSGDLAISAAAGLGVGTNYSWVIENNQFLGNDGHITVGMSGASIAFNRFSYINNTKTTATQVVLTGGKDNSVHDNYFDLPYNTNGITAMFALGTNDRWYWNKFATAVTTTLSSFGAPSS